MFPYYGEAYDDFTSFVTQYYSDNPALPKEIFLPPNPAEERPAAVETLRRAQARSRERLCRRRRPRPRRNPTSRMRSKAG